MYSFQDLTEHLKNKHNLPVDPNQFQDLRNIGYYHGFKGYRFIRKQGNLINFTAFGQIVDLNNFDMQLKGLFYPNLMFIENALKSYVLEATLAECQSEKLNEVYKKGLTYYKEFNPGTPDYKKEFKRKMDLEMKITNALIRDYMADKAIELHFYNQDRDIPVWAAFESLTLGEFGTFFACSNKNIRLAVSEALQMPTNLNSDGFLIKDIIFSLKDLRNAIAHNGTIFDTRFTTSKISNRICKLLENELKIQPIDFNYICSYIALICFLLKRMGQNKKGKSFINEYLTLQKMLGKLPPNTSMKIFGSNEAAVIAALTSYLT